MVATEHNCQRDLMEMIAAGLFADLPKGAVLRLTVVHDDDCPIFVGGACNCQPEYQLGDGPEVK
jgi:hypothetical protein